MSDSIDDKIKTAIVIDDDHDMVDVFCDILQILQIKVVGRGYDGNEAVDLYQKLKPELVILDIMMPHYDGIYALEKIREIDADAKVMVVTADSTSATNEKLKRLKPTVVVYKPADTETILGIVSGLMSVRNHNI